MGGNGNSPHGNPMGMGISQKIGNWDGKEWELNRWEWEGMGMLKAIPAHLYTPGRQVRSGQAAQVPADQSASSLSANPSSSASSVDVTRSIPIWSPADYTVIKHIPRSARTSCASHLAALLRKTVSNPDSASNWLELFNWGHTVLHAPK